MLVAFDPPMTVRRRGILQIKHLRTELEAKARELAGKSVALLEMLGRSARGIVVLVAAQGYSADVAQARRRNPDIDFVIPDAGGPDDVLDRLVFTADLGDDEDRYESAWDEVKGA
ncbi:MAG: hypothetical protein FJW86_08230 [Actinobacteria bacterium]|nr:hypothetical protein [Actinomycetota bacterium]